MKKVLSLLLCIACILAVGCGLEENTSQITPTHTSTATATNEATLTPDDTVTSAPDATPDLSLEPENSATVTPTPVPTPKPTIRPAQTESIVPAELLVTGYTTPLDPKSVNFPANYEMPYYIEVDVTNQCVNIFIKDEATGAYNILLNRFVCSGGTSTKPTKKGNFFIKSDAEQKKATGQNVKYTRYYFKNYDSYAYYITRYSNEYMFHSFTFEANSAGTILPKRNSYYNMGNTGSAGCLRMLMNHAKWIYDNIDAGTYCVVNSKRPTDKALRTVLKKYVPTLGYDMWPEWNGDRSNTTGLTRTEYISNPDTITTPTPVTPTPEITPTPEVTPTPTDVIPPSATATTTVSPTVTVTPTNTVPPSTTPPTAPSATATSTDESE